MEKEMIIKDEEDKEFYFKLICEKDHIHFWLKEKNLYAPFTFQKSFTKEEIIRNHVIFKSCDDLEEIFDHLVELTEKGKMKLFDSGKSTLSIIFYVDFISELNQKTKKFNVERVMTEEKEEALLKMYEIEKDHLALFRTIKKLINKNILKEHPFYKEINQVLEECEFKLDY